MANDQIKIKTPVGELHWVNISGQGKENYNQDGYNYVATIYLGGEKAETLKAAIDEVLGTVPKGKTLKSTGYTKLYKDAEGNLFAPTANRKFQDDEWEDEEGNKHGPDTETDMYSFRFTTRTTFEENGKTKEIGVYNKDAKKISLGDRKVGNGSLGAISGKMQKFEKAKDVGVSLFLNAIQITKFVEYSGDAGFEQEEGDFENVEDQDTGFTGDAEETPVKEKTKPRI